MPVVGPRAPVIRRLEKADEDAALRFLEDEIDAGPSGARMGEIIRGTAKGESAGAVAMIDGDIIALAIYGQIAGTERAAALYGIVVRRTRRRDGVGRAMLAFMRAGLKNLDPLVAELPADSATGSCETFLRVNGFEECGRVADYYANGMPLLILVDRVPEI